MSTTATPAVTVTYKNTYPVNVNVNSPSGQIVGPTQDLVIPFTLWSSAGQVGLSGDKGTITDEESGLGAYNDVIHSKFEYAGMHNAINRSFQLPAYANSDGAYLGDIEVLLDFNGHCDRWLGMASTSVPTTGRPDLVASATNDLSNDDYYEKFDLPLFLAELKDFSVVYKSIVRKLRKSRPSTLRRFTSRWGLTPGKTIDAAVSADLTWKLALKPFYEGVRELSSHAESLNRLAHSMANPNPYRMYGNAVDVTNDVTTNGDPGNYQYTRHLTTTERAVAWVMVRNIPVGVPNWDLITGKNTRSPLNPFRLGDSREAYELRKFANRKLYGTTARASLIWELVPLSFVLDWFIDIGGFIKQFERPRFSDLGVEVMASGYSLKRTLSYTDSLTWTLGPGKGLISDLGACSATGTYYTRVKGPLDHDNSYVDPVKIGWPTLGQGWTLAEIVYLLRGR